MFREALAINPQHEDSDHYLSNFPVVLGDIPGAIAQLDELARINRQNHRAFHKEGRAGRSLGLLTQPVGPSTPNLEHGHRPEF